MGLEDREYLRDEARRYGEGGGGFGFGARTSMSENWAIRVIVILNIIVWVLQLGTEEHLPNGMTIGGATDWFSLSLNDLASFQIWRLLTYGFCHATSDPWHLAFNMLFLWMFGRMIEGVYGSREFLGMYLTGIVVSGVVQVIFTAVIGQPDSGTIGASGAVNAVVILTAMHFPRMTVYVMFVLPMQLWVLAILKVALDTMGMLDADGHVAHAAHLGGAAFGYLYFVRGWRIMPLLSGLDQFSNPVSSMQRKMRDRKRKKELQVFEPNDDELREEVDRLLEKIKNQGEASLTDEERQTLERASRVFKGR